MISDFAKHWLAELMSQMVAMGRAQDHDDERIRREIREIVAQHFARVLSKADVDSPVGAPSESEQTEFMAEVDIAIENALRQNPGAQAAKTR